MPRSKIIALFVPGILITLACATVTNLMKSAAPEPEGVDAPSATEAPIPDAAPSVENDPFCPDITAQIMKEATSIPEDAGSEDHGSRRDDNATYLVTYEVDGDQIDRPDYEVAPADLQAEQDDTTTQAEIWKYFVALIPVEDRQPISEFTIMTDGKDNILAAVTQTQSDAAQWALEVDILDSKDTANLTYTLVHEFGHVLTLGPGQVAPSLAVFNNPDDNDIYLQELSACKDYFPGEGCSKPDSYINAFYDQFWKKIHAEWNNINLEENDNAYYDRLDKFYSKYKDQFVNDYAVTNPEEDIAESWSYFVLAPKPEGSSIAEEKIRFFYDYPELAQLRGQILDNLCAAFPQ